MWHKVAWLSILMTLAFWAGCAGENQNYKINEERTPMFEEGYPTQPIPQASAGRTSPSVQDLRREHWQRITVLPVSGRTPHHPAYFSRDGFGHRWRLSEDRPSPLRRDGDMQAQATAVTGGARERFDGEDAGDLALAPAKSGLDLLILPIHAAAVPPWSIHYSPRP